jgi:hypothetical protein
MASAPRKRHLSSEQRRALELLASSPHGATEELLAYGHGFSRRMVAGLVLVGLATVRRRVIMAGDTPVEVGKVMITEVGRRLGWTAVPSNQVMNQLDSDGLGDDTCIASRRRATHER